MASTYGVFPYLYRVPRNSKNKKNGGAEVLRCFDFRYSKCPPSATNRDIKHRTTEAVVFTM
jgi:hypothetical protein